MCDNTDCVFVVIYTDQNIVGCVFVHSGHCVGMERRRKRGLGRRKWREGGRG